MALGVGPGGRTVSVDLVADGPHALVAGTTGAGKSELLTTLVLALALTHPPDRLAILLVDFKGGTGLGPVAGLPHVLEHVTDLDASHARRVLASLRAELRRREAVLAAAGARDLLELDPADRSTPPRLLVVVDELRALIEDVPDASAALTRIAAQGRALGVHLVLATQRPAGAVGADLRANVALRIALRVTDQADSTDVLDAPDAARLDPATPGRAWVRRGTRPLEPVQVARAVAPAPPAAGRRASARAWSDVGTAWSPAPPAGPPVDDAARGVAAGRRAGRDRAAPTRHRCPWLPGLPAVVRVADVPEGPGSPSRSRTCPRSSAVARCGGTPPTGRSSSWADRVRAAPRRWSPQGWRPSTRAGPCMPSGCPAPRCTGCGRATGTACWAATWRPTTPGRSPACSSCSPPRRRHPERASCSSSTAWTCCSTRSAGSLAARASTG